ncbi:efflux RND transporter periplasmic adaptor subunit [bacterium]|nr:efflux RND transporter periplasmic adaptor subunit [bacterium]
MSEHPVSSQPVSPEPIWRQYLNSIVILGSLAAIGAWGHAYHWSIPGLNKAHAEEHSVSEHADKPAETQADANHIKLPDTKVVEKSQIEIENPRQERIERLIHANGVVDFNQTRVAQLSVKVPGSMWRVEKMIGSAVQKGDVLAIVDAMEVGKAKAAFLSAMAELVIREQILARLKSIDGVVTERQIREAEVAFRQADIDLFNTREALANLGLPIDASEAKTMPREQLLRKIHFLGLPASIADALDPATSTANLIPLIAPFTGIVTGRDAVVGEVVQPSTPVFTVVDLSQMWVTLDVRIEDADLIKIGQTVHFRPDGRDQEVTGTVNWIAAAIDPKTRTLKVRVDVANPTTDNGSNLVETRYLRAHTFGTGSILVDSDEDAVVISKKCIQWDDDVPTVFIKTTPTDFERRPITMGIDNGMNVQILGGVEVKDSIVNLGSRLLHSQSYSQRLKGN